MSIISGAFIISGLGFVSTFLGVTSCITLGGSGLGGVTSLGISTFYTALGVYTFYLIGSGMINDSTLLKPDDLTSGFFPPFNNILDEIKSSISYSSTWLDYIEDF